MATAMNPAYLLDPSLYGDQQAIGQQQELAALLMKQGLSPLQNMGSADIPSRISPVQSMAKIAALLSGQDILKQSNLANQQLMQRQSAAMLPMFGMGAPSDQGGAQPGGQSAPMGQGAAVGQGGGPLSVSGASPMTNLMSYSTDPTQHMKAVMDQYAATPEMKMAGAAYGIGSPRYMQALAAQVQKAGYIPAEEVKAGNTAIDPITKRPIAFGVKVPDGAQPSFGQDGQMTRMDMVPGATGAMAAGRAAEGQGSSQNEMITVDMPDGSKQNMTRAQAVQWANGANNAPQFSLAPGTDLTSARAAVARGGDPAALQAFDTKYGNKMPGFGSGQSTANREGAMVGTKDVIGRNQAILADANAAPQDIESLNRMMELTKTAQFGPGASNVARWKAMAAQFPGMNLIVDPQTLEAQQANVTEMKKYMSNMAGRMSGSSGTGTDARLQNAIDSLPNDAAPNAAILKVAPMLVAQRTARLDEANLRSQLGNDPTAIQQFETKWRSTYNPLAYEAAQATRGMTPQDAAMYVRKNYTPSQAAEIMRSRAALRSLGVQF